MTNLICLVSSFWKHRVRFNLKVALVATLIIFPVIFLHNSGLTKLEILFTVAELVLAGFISHYLIVEAIIKDLDDKEENNDE